MRNLFYVLIAAMFGFASVGCDVDVQDEGKLPDVDVSAEEGEMPDIDVQDEGELPDVDVSAEEGEMPDIDVEGPDVDVEEEKVTVPTLDVDPADEDETGADEQPE